MPDEKVYSPEVVPDNPFPNEEGTEAIRSEVTQEGIHSPATTPATKIPEKRAAIELLSSALNTRTKRILQEFELELSGGFKIGNFKDGVTGDVRITPNGITARDKAGVTTLALDGLTGDAIFKGKIQSGAVVTETLWVGNNSIIISGTQRRMTFYDADGTPQIVIGNVD